MPTFNLDLLEYEYEALGVVQPHITTPLPTPAGQPTAWEVRSVDHEGNVYARYPHARLSAPVSETINGIETGAWELPLDEDISEIQLPNRELVPDRGVQIWRNGHLLFWGPPTTLRANSTDRKWSFGLKGPWWYFGRRHIGKSNRTDLLRHVGNFEGSDLAAWTQQGTNITVTADSTIKLLDDKSAKIVTTFSGDTRYISEEFVLDGGTIGVAVFLVGWMNPTVVTSAPPLDLAALLAIYPTAAALAADTPRVQVGATYAQATAVSGGWRRFGAVAHVLPNTTEIVQVRLYPPIAGTIYFDAVRLVVMESFALVNVNSPGGAGWDQVSIAHQLIDHLQGKGSTATTFGEHNGKSDLHIAVAGDPSGVVKERVYQHYEHARGYAGGQGSGALDEFMKASDGFDIRIDLTETTRTARTYYPRVGTDWEGFTLRYIRNVTDDGEVIVDRWGIVEWDYAASIEEAANDITTLGGWGSGAGREEGAFYDPDSMGGLTLERVEAAPTGTPIDLLDAVAEARAAQLEQSVDVLVLTVTEPTDLVTGEVTFPLVGVLRAGDSVPIIIEDGGLVIDARRRIVKVDINPNDTLTLTINRDPTAGGS